MYPSLTGPDLTFFNLDSMTKQDQEIFAHISYPPYAKAYSSHSIIEASQEVYSMY